MPVEPPPLRWAFPPVDDADADGLVGVGADLEPGTILAAYRRGMFPMPLGAHGPIGWWSPDPRAVIPLDGLRVSRSLRRSLRRYEIRVDTAFARGDRRLRRSRSGRTAGSRPRSAVPTARCTTSAGCTRSEAWSCDDGELAGGLYGLAIGGLFAGESMFHRRTDASKVALVGLVELLRDDGVGPAGCSTSSGRRPTSAVARARSRSPRADYVARVAAAVELPAPRGLRRVSPRPRSRL